MPQICTCVCVCEYCVCACVGAWVWVCTTLVGFPECLLYEFLLALNFFFVFVIVTISLFV